MLPRFKSLFSQFALSLMLLFCLVGTLVVALTLLTSDLYYQEVNQKLNKEVANHIVNETRLIKNGHLNQAALKSLFHSLMVFNPSLEIYLLDDKGRILAFSAPPSKVKRSSVSIEPVKQYLENDTTQLIKGEDPRNLEAFKIFSAAPIHLPGEFDGYLYVIVGGEKYDSILQKVKSSHVLSLSMVGIAIGSIFSLITAMLLFSGLTRRLKKLSLSMFHFQQDGNNDMAHIPNYRSNGDEIDSLTETFVVMANKIHAQLDKLETVDRLRRELVANVSHDLRTPLATLQGYIETLILKNEHLESKERQLYLHVAIKHCERLNKLVTELFDLAKLDAGDTRVHNEPFNVLELIQDVVLKFQLVAQEKQVSMKIFDNQELPFVFADIGLIERVVENLLENALRHTPVGGVIDVQIIPGKDGVAVNIKDNGCGIPESEIPYIFDRFYQLDKNRTLQDGSSGLGLAIVKRIIELHKSDIKVTSQPHNYTTFSFMLPAY